MVSIPGNSEKREEKIDKKMKTLNVRGFFISQNMHIKKIISKQGFWYFHSTADPGFLELQNSMLSTWESRGPNLRAQSPYSLVFHT